MPWFNPPEPNLSRWHEWLKKESKKFSQIGKEETMRKETGKKNEGIPKDIVGKAIRLDNLRSNCYAIEKEVKELTGELREYVIKKSGRTLKIENQTIEVWLEPNQRVHIQSEEFYKLLGDEAFDFMEVKRKKAEESMKNGLLAADPDALDRLPTITEFLEPRVKVKIKQKKEEG